MPMSSMPHAVAAVFALGLLLIGRWTGSPPDRAASRHGRSRQAAPALRDKAAAEDAESRLARRKASELLAAIDSLLTRTAKERGELKDLPSRDNYVIPPLWTGNPRGPRKADPPAAGFGA